MNEENRVPQQIPPVQDPQSLPFEKRPFYRSLAFLIIGVILILLIVSGVVFAFLRGKENTREDFSSITPTPMQIVSTPTPEDIQVYELELVLNQPVTIPGTTIELELMSTVNQQSDCFDCISSTTVEMRQNGEIRIWDYSCGGFSGECNYQFKEFGYVVEAQELKAESMLVKVYPDTNDN